MNQLVIVTNHHLLWAIAISTAILAVLALLGRFGR